VLPKPFMVEVDQIPVGIVLLEHDGMITAVNSAACSLFARTREGLIGTSGLSLLQLGADAWYALLGGLVEHGRADANVHVVRPGGSATVQLVASPVAHGSRPMVQIVAVDASAHAGDARPHDGAEEQAATKQRLESLGLVAGGIAHDFNNLLVGVLAEASAAREDRNLGEGAREALRRIEAAAGRMSQLTRQLLAYAGRGRLVTTQLDPDAMVAELGDPLSRIIQAPAILEVTPGAGVVVVEADPNLLRQVVINLVANANDAGGKRVQVATRILSRENAPWWQLEVSDDGMGMDPATLSHIFDPFFTTKKDRHGLGLSAVHGIVRRLGGDVEVDSRPGQGARFRVRLPIVPGADPPPRAKAEPTMQGPRLAGLRVLVADDEPSVRATVRRLLERRGATVVVASDGLEAEARLRDERFDLMVCDVVMPGHGGYDVLAFARAMLPKLPVILMSGYTGRVRGEGAEEEPDAFIEKPFTAKVLDLAINEVLGNRAIAERDVVKRM
jgi:two-component system, cell cycle sensor histidine kinase and response regulator CckA